MKSICNNINYENSHLSSIGTVYSFSVSGSQSDGTHFVNRTAWLPRLRSFLLQKEGSECYCSLKEYAQCTSWQPVSLESLRASRKFREPGALVSFSTDLVNDIKLSEGGIGDDMEETTDLNRDKWPQLVYQERWFGAGGILNFAAQPHPYYGAISLVSTSAD